MITEKQIRYWESMKGKKPANLEMLLERIQENKGNKHYKWKGENAGYHSKHIWISNNFGKPDKCISCGEKGKFVVKSNGVKMWSLHWANISGEYKRIREDWIGLCPQCHWDYDKEERRQKREEKKQKTTYKRN